MAPLGTYTKDEGWRDTLKVGDIVDVMDTLNKKWNTSTVVEEEGRKGDEITPIIKVGFRFYHEKATSKDAMGTYFGAGEA